MGGYYHGLDREGQWGLLFPRQALLPCGLGSPICDLGMMAPPLPGKCEDSINCTGQWSEPGPPLCRSSLALWNSHEDSLGQPCPHSSSRFHISPLRMLGRWEGSGLPRRSQDALTVSLPTAVCSSRNLPCEAWASWGMFVGQDGGEGKAGFATSGSGRFGVWPGPAGLLAFRTRAPWSPWAGPVH